MSRICIIRHYYYPEDPRSRREAEALAEAGHEVDILTLRHTGEPVHEVINGVRVRRLPVEHYRRSLFHYAYEYSAFFILTFLILTARLARRRYRSRHARMHTRTLLHEVPGDSKSPHRAPSCVDRATKPRLRGSGNHLHAPAACYLRFPGHTGGENRSRAQRRKLGDLPAAYSRTGSLATGREIRVGGTRASCAALRSRHYGAGCGPPGARDPRRCSPRLWQGRLPARDGGTGARAWH